MKWYSKLFLGVTVFATLAISIYDTIDSEKKRVEDIYSSFSSGKDIYCKDYRVNKERGWSLTKEDTLFVKNDIAIKADICSKEK